MVLQQKAEWDQNHREAKGGIIHNKDRERQLQKRKEQGMEGPTRLTPWL